MHKKKSKQEFELARIGDKPLLLTFFALELAEK